MKKLFKLRFSYFLIAGLIGYVLNLVSYFMWTNEQLAYSQIKASSSMDYYNRFVQSSYFALFGALFILVMAIGFFICSNWKQKLVKIPSVALGVLELGIFITLIIYLVYSKNNRANLDEEECEKFVTVLVNMKNAFVYASTCASTVIGAGLIKAYVKNETRKLSCISAIVFTCGSGLAFTSFTMMYFASIGTYSNELMVKWFASSYSIGDFKSTFGSMNGLTFASGQRFLTLIEEVSTALNPKEEYSKISIGAVFSLILVISYGISIVTNILFTVGTLVESFDVSRDDSPLEI